MKSYSEIFNEVLKVYRFETIQDLHESAEPTTLQSFMYDLSLETQKECLKNASERTSEQYVRPITLNYQEIKDLIINKNNLVK